eukprot:scaffold135897_cov21-Tisochrysis_lutea.AAC.2
MERLHRPRTGYVQVRIGAWCDNQLLSQELLQRVCIALSPYARLCPLSRLRMGHVSEWEDWIGT